MPDEECTPSRTATQSPSSIANTQLTIDDGTVIGAGSVVTHAITANAKRQ
ncbi:MULTISPECIES: hypothetical protein [Bifidobacterium]|nr:MULTISPECIES: hypothetical protein [Bifidobacterium]